MENAINSMSEEKVKMLFAYPVALCGTILNAICINTFIYSAKLVPGGMSGLSLITQGIITKFFAITIPFTLLNVLFNLPAACLSFKWVGKKFTILSFVLMLTSSLLVDILPKYQVTHDPLLAAVFAGILNGVSSAMMLNQGVSGGGTDFIAMSLSSKYNISAFNYMLIFNVLLITIQGFNYGITTALYSIIFQFVSTQVINYMYRRFKKQTLLIITSKGDEIGQAIIKLSQHSASKIDVIGCYSQSHFNLIYSLITQPQFKYVIPELKKIDPKAFINVLETNRVEGEFYYAQVGALSN